MRRFHAPPNWTSPYGLAFVVLLVALAGPFCGRPTGDWDQVFVPAADRLRTGGELFEGAFVYPPFAAWVVVPFTHLPHRASVLAWYAVSAVALAVLIRRSWRLAGGGDFPNATVGSRREHLILWAGLACGLCFAFDGFANRQIDLPIAALVVAGCRHLVARRDAGAGLSFGVAAALKCTPLLWAAYLGWTRRYRAAGLIVPIALAMNVLPDVTHPGPRGSRLAQWAEKFLRPMLDRDYDPGTWATAITYNHSVAGVCNRWLTDGAARVSPRTLKAIVYGIDGLLVVAAVAAAGVSRRAVRRDLPKSVGHNAADALECSVVVLLMLLLSPQSSKPHYCVLTLPGFCLARLAVERRSRVLGGLVAVAVVGALLSNRDLLGARAYATALWHGSLFWATAALFAGCVWALWMAAPGRGEVSQPSDWPGEQLAHRVAA
jgi:hypothetical protein